MQPIGFIGAGMMGAGMCRNLIKAGHAVAVIAHRNRKPIDELVALGAIEVATLAEIARHADIVMLCVDRADTVERILGGLEPHLRAGQIVIDATTSRPDVTTALAARLAARGITLIDAPVVGGPVQAAEGVLGSLVGGADDVVARIRPILATYSKEIIHFGPVGAGITAKLLNNFLTQGTCQLITQAYRAARRHGVDWDKLYAIMQQGAARSGSLERIVGSAVKGNYRGQMFAIANAAKDVDYAGSLVGDDPDGAALQAAVHGALMRAIDAGMGDRFVSEMLDPEIEAAVARGRT